MRLYKTKTMFRGVPLLLAAGAIMMSSSVVIAQSSDASFGPNNPFFAPSKLPFQAPPFDKIKDSDYQPAIEAGMAEQLKEVRAIAENPAAPTFENTVVAMEKTGDLLNRVSAAFNGIAGANTNPVLEKLQEIEAPKLAAHQDAIYLDAKLFQRFATIYKERNSLKLDAESLRLVEYYYQQFEMAGANLSDADKDRLKKLNEEESTLSNAFRTKVLAATKDAAYATTDKGALAGLSEAQIGGAAELAKSRKKEG
jgi:peptidyl-dipeptidase Dcp